MTTDISPFQLHLILKFENGQELTPNEIRKAQKLGIDYPWPAGESWQPEKSNENEGGDEAGQKKQKGDSSSVTGDDAQQKGPSVNPVQKCWFPHCPHTQSRSGGHWPGCCYAVSSPTAKYSQYRPPIWARETQRDPNGNPIPRWYPPDDSDGRLDTRIYGRFIDPNYPTARYSQYRPPIWARETQRDPNGNPIPRWYPPDDSDGRLDTRIYGRYLMPDWKAHPEKYPRGPPIPPWVPIQYLSHSAQPAERDPRGDSTAHGYDPTGGDERADTRDVPTQSFKSWTDWARQPTSGDPVRLSPFNWDWAAGSDWLGNHPVLPRAHWAQAYPHYIPVDGADRHPISHYQFQYKPPTPTFPTHTPFPYGFPDRNWRQVITTSSGEEDAGAAKPNGSALRPSQTYAWPGTGVGLRIGTGGSDQSGLLVKLLDKYIQECVEVKQESPFLVEFYSSDSAVTIDYLTENIIDLGFTDTILLDTLLKDQGIADRRETGWRDHWMLVGPKENPIGLPEKTGTSVHALFATIYTKLQADPDGPTIFLSRSDASSSYVKESSLWSAIGRTPSTSATATWYASSGSSAADTLAEAALIGAYTLTDSDTWLSASEEIRSKLTTFTVATDAENLLLKPAELVVGSSAKNKDRANDFVDWVISEEGGQEVIKAFTATRTVVPPASGSSDAAAETSSKTATVVNSATNSAA